MCSSSLAFRPPRPTPQPQPLGPIALLNALRRNPLECWSRQHFEQPIVFGGLPFARVVLVSDPAAIGKVLGEDAHHYRKSALERRILSPRLRNGLVAVDGDRWSSQRRTLAPLLGRKAVMQFAPAMADAVTALIRRWHDGAQNDVLEIRSEMSALALDCLARSIFHHGFGGDADNMRAAMASFFASGGRIDLFDIIGLPDFIPRVSHLRIRRLLRAFDEYLAAAIAERRTKLVENPAAAPRDLLGILLAARDPETGKCMSEAEVKANVFTFFLAGQETTSTALTWAIYLLSQSQEWQERVRAESERELKTPEAVVDRLVETRAVLDEAMRLYPPIVGITRTADRTDELGGHSIERGTLVVISPYVLHRHRLLWDDPDTFDPSRFLPGAPRRINRYAYLPFGIGPRMCIGAGFALHEATLALAAIVRDFTLALAPGQSVWPLQRLTLRPRDPLLMIAKARNWEGTSHAWQSPREEKAAACSPAHSS